MLRAVERYSQRHRLLAEGEHAVVAVSGGADSVALLHVLLALASRHGWRLTVAHLDHGLRGKAAVADAAFVKDLAANLGVLYVGGRARVRAEARRKGLSLEMAAREARYRFLARTARRVGADCVATGHTSDDQAETVLLKLTRGAGMGGLSGMAARTEWRRPRQPLCRVVRPLLACSRQQVETFLRRRGLAWREDASNTDARFLRNRVRHEVLPLLAARLNPRVKAALCRAAGVLAEEDSCMDAVARRALAACQDRDGALMLERVETGTHPAAWRRMLRLWLVGHGVAPSEVTFALLERAAVLAESAVGSASMDLSGGRRVRRSYNRLEVCGSHREADCSFRVRLALPGETLIETAGLRVTTHVAPGILREGGLATGVFPAAASIRRAAVGRRALWARSWRPGDRMRPFGMQGTRKLQDIFTDAKVPVESRARIPVFECGGDIVWLPGYRIAQGWAVASETEPSVQISVVSRPQAR